MIGVEDVPTTFIAAPVIGDCAIAGGDLNPVDVGVQHDVTTGISRGHRVAVAVEKDQTGDSGSGRPGNAAAPGPRRQGQKMALLLLPGLAPCLVSAWQAAVRTITEALAQQCIQLLQGHDPRQGYQKVAPGNKPTRFSTIPFS